MPTLGEILPRLLRDMGIDTVFGIPGVHTVELYRGLPASGLRHITPRHEQAAGFMADGYARVSGRPAACFIISGPGMTNIATAMAQAYADSIPMLVISSVLNRSEIGRGEGRLHDLKNQSALIAGVAAWSHTLMSPAELPAVLARAAAVFRATRPRPVHIELPLDVIVAEAGDLALTLPVLSAPAPDAAAITQAAELLQNARRPLMVIGGGTSGAAPAVRHLAERLGAPVLATINAKGVLAPDHPLLVGGLLPEQPVLDELAAADVILALGTELGETDTWLFGSYPDIIGALIRIDIDPEQLNCNAPATLGIVADAGAAATALSAALPGATTPGGPERARALRKAALSSVEPAYLAHGRIMTRLAQNFPGLIIASDSTQPAYGANLTYDAPLPRSYFTSATGFGTLGHALPAAFGAKLACPERPVMALIGDGAFQFTLPELATAVELGLPVPIVLWNNQGYGEIKSYMAERQIPQIGVDIYTPDFQTIAKGFGAYALTVHSLDALVDALRRALAADRPTVIELDDAEARTW